MFQGMAAAVIGPGVQPPPVIESFESFPSFPSFPSIIRCLLL